MKQFIRKALACTTFTVVFFLHIYFALLLTTRQALAQEGTPEPAQIEKVDAAKPAPPKPPAPPKINLDEDINIKLDMKDGLTIKGIDKVIEKAKELEKYEDEHGEMGDDEDAHEHVRREKHVRIEHQGQDWEDILVPIGFFAMIMGIVYLVISSKNKARREYLETIRLMVEKGQPIPEDLMKSVTKRAHGFDTEQYHSHLIKGLKPIFWGIGVLVFFISTSISGPLFLATIPMVVGAYFVTKSYLIEKEKLKNPQGPVDPAKVDTAKTDGPKL